MEQMKFKALKSRPVSINRARQNCYVCDTLTVLQSMTHIEPEKTYASLERQLLPNGYVEGIELKDYPINSKSVTSYADGADYRNDPAQAVANAPKRVNIGDIAQLQDFMNNNPQEAVRVLRDVVAKLKVINNQSVSSATATATATETENKSE